MQLNIDETVIATAIQAYIDKLFSGNMDNYNNPIKQVVEYQIGSTWESGKLPTEFQQKIKDLTAKIIAAEDFEKRLGDMIVQQMAIHQVSLMGKALEDQYAKSRQ